MRYSRQVSAWPRMILYGRVVPARCFSCRRRSLFGASRSKNAAHGRGSCADILRQLQKPAVQTHQLHFNPLFEPPAAPLQHERSQAVKARPSACVSTCTVLAACATARAAASAAGSSACAQAACAARIAFFASGILISPRAQAPARASACAAGNRPDGALRKNRRTTRRSPAPRRRASGASATLSARAEVVCRRFACQTGSSLPWPISSPFPQAAAPRRAERPKPRFQR